MNIYVSDIKKNNLSIADMENVLPRCFLVEAEKYKTILDYQRSLVGYYILFNKIKCELSDDSTNFKLIKNKYGKPFLLDRDNYFFNITHSGDLVAVAISDMEIGVDVEFKFPFDYGEIIDFVLSESEKNFYFKASYKFKKDIFYRFWTLKESYIKAIGLGMSKQLHSFSIELWNKEIKVNDNKEMRFLEIPFYKNYSFSICHHKTDKIKKFEVIKI